MLSNEAMTFMEHLADKYKQTNVNEFDFMDYMSIPAHDVAIPELVDKGYLIKKNNILGTISINLDALD